MSKIDGKDWVLISKLGGVAWKTRDWGDEVLNWVIQDLINRELVEVDAKDGVKRIRRIRWEGEEGEATPNEYLFHHLSQYLSPRLTRLTPCRSKPHLILTQFSPRLTRLTPTAQLLSQNYAYFFR